MDYEKKAITLAWKIENLKNFRHKETNLYSPVFSIGELEGSKWRLGVLEFKFPTISLSIKRDADADEPEEFKLYFQFYIRVLDESPSSEKSTILIHTFHAFKKHKMSRAIEMTHQTVCPDAIVIQCKLWNPKASILNPGHYFAQTRLAIQKHRFSKKVENFSDLSCEKRMSKVVLSSTGGELMVVNFHLYTLGACDSSTLMDVEIIPFSELAERYYNFRVFVLDSSGKKMDIGMFEKRRSRRRGCLSYELPYHWKENIRGKDDNLCVHCKFTVWSGIEYEKVERIEFESDFVSQPKLTGFTSTVQLLTSKKGTPCDTKVQTATETFPVHTEVLSAQSPVFEAMFNSNMKETIQKCVRIDDVDAETMKRMFVFLYSDTLEEMEWKDAMNLYIAADKYQIRSLKQKCIDFLKQNIDLSNCIVLLILADTHQDKDLDKAVKSVIARYSPEVFHFDEWRSFERNLPHLAVQTLRDLLLEYRSDSTDRFEEYFE